MCPQLCPLHAGQRPFIDLQEFSILLDNCHSKSSTITLLVHLMSSQTLNLDDH